MPSDAAGPAEFGAADVFQQAVDAVVVETHAVDDALGLGMRNRRGRRLPAWGPRRDRADLDEAEAEPGQTVDGSPFLSRPAARPTGLGNLRPMTSTGQAGTGLATRPAIPVASRRRPRPCRSVGGFGVEGEEEFADERIEHRAILPHCSNFAGLRRRLPGRRRPGPVRCNSRRCRWSDCQWRSDVGRGLSMADIFSQLCPGRRGAGRAPRRALESLGWSVVGSQDTGWKDFSPGHRGSIEPGPLRRRPLVRRRGRFPTGCGKRRKRPRTEQAPAGAPGRHPAPSGFPCALQAADLIGWDGSSRRPGLPPPGPRPWSLAAAARRPVPGGPLQAPPVPPPPPGVSWRLAVGRRPGSCSGGVYLTATPGGTPSAMRRCSRSPPPGKRKGKAPDRGARVGRNRSAKRRRPPGSSARPPKRETAAARAGARSPGAGRTRSGAGNPAPAGGRRTAGEVSISTAASPAALPATWNPGG